MKFIIMNREEAFLYSQKTHNETSAIISITDPNNANNDISITNDNKIKDVLFLKFEDILENDKQQAMTTEDALKIKDFFDKWIKEEKVDTIIVHCDGGVSRSSGICAALMFVLLGDDMIIWENYKYSPNTHCYKKVLSVFSDKDFTEEVLYKEALNAEKWLEYFEANF